VFLHTVPLDSLIVGEAVLGIEVFQLTTEKERVELQCHPSFCNP
jgi:hypothetical protein